MTGRRMRRTCCAPLLLATVLLGACGQQYAGQDTASPATTTIRSTTTESPAGPPATGTSAPISEALPVTETEYAIALPRASLPPGSYTFRVKNAGSAPHDLVITGPGVDSARTNVLDGGQEESLSVTLQAGTYELWCSVDNHRERGMSTMLTVG